MTAGEWLGRSTRLLHEAGVSSARLDCQVLLADNLGCDKSFVLAHPESVIDLKRLKILNTKVVQRSRHVPLAYIRGKAEFYGREFKINRHVLVPRPESEAMITLLKQVIGRNKPTEAAHRITIYDIGAGSGCLAVTASLELASVDVVAVDISESCLRLTAQNAALHHAQLITLAGDMLLPVAEHMAAALPKQVIFLANLPYVPSDYPINRAATHEPAEAIFSGRDGLDHYRKLFVQLTGLPVKPVYVITESLLNQHDPLASLAKSHNYEVHLENGLAQCFRLVGWSAA